MKKPTRKSLVIKLDTVFSQYIRRKDVINGLATCVTCGKKSEPKKMQNGHFMSRRHYATRWLENNVGVQCYACNITNQGMQYQFGKYLGNKISEEMYIQSHKTVKFTDLDLIDMIDYYTNKLNDLESL